MSKPLIHIVEDEEDIQDVIEYNLRREGYRVLKSMSGEEGLDKILKQAPDLLILDLMLPGMDGLEVCRRVRREGGLSSMRILMLTAKGEDADIVTGLELGANDYMTKPFSTRVLLARVKALLRRETGVAVSDELVRIHDISIHPQRQEVLIGDQKVDLTFSEFKTFHALASRPGWVFTRGQIVSLLRGNSYLVTDRAVDVMIVGLRKKLGEAARYIQTVRGMGYRFKDNY